MNNFSKAVALYLAPLLMLTSILLTFFAFFAPVGLLHNQVALIVVGPQRADNGATVDGPKVFLGLLGSCGRSKNAAAIHCNSMSLSPTYDLSVLPSNAANLVLSAPPKAAPAFLSLSLGLSFIFFIAFTLISYRNILGAKISAALSKPIISRVSIWIGVLGFLLGLASFLIVRMYCGKTVDDFNSAINHSGSASKAGQLAATTSNGFIMVYIGYSFHAIPLVISLTKWHVQAESTGKA